MWSGLSVDGPSKAASRISSTVDRFASPGMQPSLAHEPNATRNRDLRRSRCASSSLSVVRIPPVNRQRSIEPSAIASTSRSFTSITAGQKTISNAAATSAMRSWRFRIAMSQPPHADAQ